MTVSHVTDEGGEVQMGKQLLHGHMARTWWKWDLNLDSPYHKEMTKF